MSPALDAFSEVELAATLAALLVAATLARLRMEMLPVEWECKDMGDDIVVRRVLDPNGDDGVIAGDCESRSLTPIVRFLGGYLPISNESTGRGIAEIILQANKIK